MEKLILLHGSLGTKAEFDNVSELLSEKYEILLYEIPHHGARKDSEVPFKLESIVNDFLGFLKLMGPCYVYGFSFGGYIALSAAIKDETNFKGLITQGTKFEWSEKIADENIQQLKKEPEGKGGIAFYQYLEKLHGVYLNDLIEKTIVFTKELGTSTPITPIAVKHLNIPVRMVRGGKDAISNENETKVLANTIPNGYYFEIPSMLHPISFIPPKHLARLIEVQLQSMQYQWTKTKFGEIAYQMIGKIQNSIEPVVLFLHESLGSIAQWKDFPLNICKTLNLPGIVLEWPGYGFSDIENHKRDENYLHNYAWEYLPEFLSSINLKNPLLIIGHSDGGTEALLYSSKFPKNVHGMVTLAAHYINEPETKAGVQYGLEAYEQGKLKGLEYYHGNKTDHLFHAWADTWLSESFKKWNIAKDIKGNPVHALIIQGNEDQYGTSDQAEGIQDLLLHAKSGFIFGCGHQPHLDQSSIVLQSIKFWWISLGNFI